MAATEVTKLELNFTDAQSKALRKSFNNANKSADASNVKALANGIITNGDIFTRVPTTIKSAEFVTTIRTPVDIS